MRKSGCYLTSYAVVLTLLTMVKVASADTIKVSYGAPVFSSAVGNTPSIVTGEHLWVDNNGHESQVDTLSDPFTENLSLKTPTKNRFMFDVEPAWHSGTCTSMSCNASNDTASSLVTLDFTFADLSQGSMPSVESSVSARYTADYFNDTDSFDWTTTSPLAVDFANGSVLDVYLVDASDWAIAPQISFEFTQTPAPPPAVPEPSSLPLIGSGMLSFIALTLWRRHRSRFNQADARSRGRAGSRPRAAVAAKS
jgi:PEP-CTERM motif